MISSKGKEKDEDAAHELAGLHIGKSSSPEQRPAQPPRPKMASPPPPPPPPAPMEEEDDYEDEDENDPFADRNALNTPKVEKGQPVWYVITWSPLVITLLITQCLGGKFKSIELTFATSTSGIESCGSRRWGAG